MALKLRRVITGHDNNGHAVVQIDDIAQTNDSISGVETSVIWSTDTLPVNNDGDKDQAKQDMPIIYQGGTVFRIIEFRPGCPVMMHRTSSIDYGLMLKGEADMELDDKTLVHLKTGDVFVQRGTIHAWHNNEKNPAIIAFILIDAKPVKAGGKVLEADVHTVK